VWCYKFQVLSIAGEFAITRLGESFAIWQIIGKTRNLSQRANSIKLGRHGTNFKADVFTKL
jgi:hypothetical protein